MAEQYNCSAIYLYCAANALRLFINFQVFAVLKAAWCNQY